MATLQTIRELTIRGRTEGVETVTEALIRMQRAHLGLADAQAVSGTASEQSARKQLSAANAWSTLQSKVDPVARALRDAAREMTTTQRALDQGIITQERFAQEAGRVARSIDAIQFKHASTEASALAARTEELRSRFDSAYAASQKLATELNDLAELERTGTHITGGYTAALDGLIMKYDATAQAAHRAAQAHTDFIASARADQHVATERQVAGTYQDRYNAQLGVSTPRTGDARGAASAFEADFARLDQIADQRAHQIGANFRHAFEESLNMGASATSRGASFTALEAAARETEEQVRAVARLRAEIDPLGAAQARLNAELADYSAMAGRAEISATELAQAQSLARARFNQATATGGGMAGGMPDRHTGANTFDASNVAFQLQDIAVTAQMGMSPIAVALQQGTQLSAVFAGMQNPIKGIGAALLSVLSPMSLLTVGAVAGGVALFQWWKNKDGIEGLDATMQRHSRTVESLKVLYGDAAKEAASISTVAGGLAVSEALVNIDERKLRAAQGRAQTFAGQVLSGNQGYFADPEQAAAGYFSSTASPKGLIDASKAADLQPYRQAINDLLADVRAGREGMDRYVEALDKARQAQGLLFDTVNQSNLGTLAAESLEVDKHFEAFAAPINKFRLSLAEGTDGVDDFIQGIREIGLGSTGLAKVADEALAAYNNVVMLGRQLEAIADARRYNEDRVSSLRDRHESDTYAGRRNGENRSIGQKAVADFYSMQARTDQERLDAVRMRVEASRRDDADKGGGLQTRITREVQLEQTRIDMQAKDAADARGRSIEQQIRQQREQVSLIGQTTAAQAAANFQFSAMSGILEEAARRGKKPEDYADEVAKIRETAAAIGAYAAQVQALQAIQNQQDQLAIGQAELASIGKMSSERERAISLARTEQEIAKSGIGIHSDLAEQWRNGAAALADLNAQKAKAQAYDEWSFDRTQMNRSPLERDIAGKLRGTAYEGNQDAATYLRGVGQAQEGREAFKGFFTDAISAARENGGKFGDAFGQAALNVTTRFADKAIENVLDSAANSLFKLPELPDSLKGGPLGSIAGAIGLGGKPDGTATNPLYVAFAGIPGASQLLNPGSLGGVGGEAARLANAAKSFASAGQQMPGLAAGGGYGSDLATNVRQLAANIGANPLDVAKVMHFESGFRQNVWGGANDNYYGLIQAGASERAQYGITPGGSLADQFGGIQRFLQGRGYKPGMSGLDLYSTINAGSPGHYRASDAANGGTWGTVADKWFKQMGSSEAAAQKLLGSSQNASAAIDRMASGSTAAASATADAAKGLTSFGGGLNQFGNALSQFPGAPSGGGGSASIFGKLLGWGTAAFGQSLSPAAWNVVSSGGMTGLFASGGYTGPGGIHDPAGVVHRGEVVWSQMDVARAGGVAAVEAMRLGYEGYDRGGSVDMPRPAMPLGMRMPANQNAASPTVIFDPKFVNAPPVREVRDEPDGRGGRRQVIVFEEIAAQANSRKGSKLAKAQRDRFGLRERMIR